MRVGNSLRAPGSSRRRQSLTVAAALVWGGASVSVAQWFDQGPVFTILEENDLVVDTDRHYTQGVKLTYLHADNRLPDWLAQLSHRIGAVGFSVQANRVGTQIGQSIYTPGDLSAPGLLTADRPYAGWLYTGLILQRRGLTPGNQLVLENFQLEIGRASCRERV